MSTLTVQIPDSEVVRAAVPPRGPFGGTQNVATGGGDDGTFDSAMVEALRAIDDVLDHAGDPKFACIPSVANAYDAEAGRCVPVCWRDSRARRHLRRIALAVAQVEAIPQG